jgi:hypothetical protein
VIKKQVKIKIFSVYDQEGNLHPHCGIGLGSCAEDSFFKTPAVLYRQFFRKVCGNSFLLDTNNSG